MLDRTSIVLVSGAISNSLDRFRTIKLEGNPFLLTKGRIIRKMSEKDVIRAIKEICRIFKNKEEYLVPILKQMQGSISAKNGNLTVQCIERYLRWQQSEPVLVFWNGSTDREIAERLGLDRYKMLELTSYDVLNNKVVYLQLKNMRSKQIIVSEEIGKVDKNGRLLKLEETHNLICSKKHHFAYAHDPCTDVKLTKCLFDKTVRACRNRNIKIYEF
jgi:hypothetical protein